MSSIRITSIFALFLLVVTSASATLAGSDQPGTKAVKGANDTLSNLLRKKVAAGSKAETKLAASVTKSVRGFLDIDELGKRALTDHWDELTEEQRTEYSSLLRELIEQNYIKGLRANLSYEVAYTGERSHRDGLIVTTEIKTLRRGRPYKIDIDYTLRKSSGKWVAFDVVTDGVGLVENYRAQFNKIIGKSGFEGLLSKMRRKRDKLAK
jgi:phospholipid transport system substrate-binding protein